MPSWKIHIFSTLLLFLFIFKIFSSSTRFSTLLQLFILGSFFSVFPDVDSRKSKIRTFLALVFAFLISFYLTLLFEFDLLFAFILFSSSFLFFKFFPTKHRGITHDLKFSIFITFSFSLILWLLWNFNFLQSFLILFLGYSSHIFLDFLSKS